MIEIMIEMRVYEISLLKRPINIGFFSMKKGRWCPGEDLNCNFNILILCVFISIKLADVTLSVT